MGIYACSKCGYPHGWSSVTMSDIPHDCPRPADQAPDLQWPRPLDWSEIDKAPRNFAPAIPTITPTAPTPLPGT